ncbi:MAG: Gfo/Idh/MocA family oxidoreductase [Candidatus Aminicenantes bacterium]
MHLNNQKKTVSIVMVGIGGYGYYYTNVLIKEYYRGLIDIIAAVEPFPENSSHSQWFLKHSIPIYHTLEQFFANHDHIDLVIICSPIHHHVPQSSLALQQGSHVLCDKPMASTVQDADSLIKLKKDSGHHVLLGYQWSYSTPIQSLKKDIQKGLFGNPIRMKSLCLWPRGYEYYSRNDWAGKLKDSDGKWILDSPANNAMAHFLHNLLYLLGKKTDSSALPRLVEAETYKVYPIQNFDTVAARILTNEGTELLFYASHSIQKSLGPLFKLEFEHATVNYGETSKTIVCHGNNSQNKDYGNPDSENQFKKFYEALNVIKNSKAVLCGPEAAYPHTLVVNGIQDSVPEANSFPSSLILRHDTGESLWGKDLGKALYNCYLNSCLPSEKSLKWAVKGRQINMKNYKFFPGGQPPSTKSSS